MIGLDRDAVDEYVRLNPDKDTVNEILKELVATGFIPGDILRRCNVSASLLRTGDLEMVLESVVSTDNTCTMFAERIADKINNPPDGEATATEAANPQVCVLMPVGVSSYLLFLL